MNAIKGNNFITMLEFSKTEFNFAESMVTLHQLVIDTCPTHELYNNVVTNEFYIARLSQMLPTKFNFALMRYIFLAQCGCDVVLTK